MKPPNLKRVAKQWRVAVRSELVWERASSQAGAEAGEAGGCVVVARAAGLRAYLKPTQHWPDEKIHARAAREKIASDLACDLGLPVPPAQLTEFTGYSAASVPAVVSLIMHPVRFHWHEFAAPELSKLPRALRSCVRRAAPMWAFDTWLGQTDHGDDSANVIVGRARPSSNPEILFLDFANSTGFDGSWSGTGWRRIAAVSFPALMRRHVDRGLLREAIDRIESMPDAVICEVVERIPASHLQASQAALIVRGLLRRRALVRGALAAELA